MTEQVAERIAVALERIAHVLETVIVSADEPPTCDHGEEKRTYVRRMGEPLRWSCDPARGGCGHRHIGS